MQNKGLRAYIQEAQEKGVAIGHFNFSSFDVAKAIVKAAQELDVPVILGLSEGERDFVGIYEAMAYVKAVREHVYDKVFLSADHTYTCERVVAVVEAGFDMVIFDGASEELEKNIEKATQCRNLITEMNQKRGTDILFEAELGYIGKSSKVLDSLPEGLQMTSCVDAQHFVEAVRPDLFAPAVGNVHGMLRNIPDPKLDSVRVGEIFGVAKVPLVLHGASGNSKEDIQACIKKGVAIVHINTEIRVAYKNALIKNLATEEIAPYKYLDATENEVKEVVKEKIKIFSF
ncbi:MAG: class II fructose-bisphosphate aldolase, partial [Patescibacteria group bacterium]